VNQKPWPAEFERIIRERLPAVPPDTRIPPDQPLFELGLDSVGAVALIAELEDGFDILVEDDLLEPDLFCGAEHLWNVVERLAAC
jgi:acyl carrier protein